MLKIGLQIIDFQNNQPKNIANIVLFCIYSILTVFLIINTTKPAYKDNVCGRLVWTYQYLNGEIKTFIVNVINLSLFVSLLVLCDIDTDIIYIGTATIILSIIYSYTYNVSISATWCLLLVFIIIVYGIFK